MSDEVDHWRRALSFDGLVQGDRVAIRLSNSREWVLADQASLANGLVVVPVYIDDRPDNIAYILAHTEARVLFLDSLAQWQAMADERELPANLKRVVIVNPKASAGDTADRRVVMLNQWLESAGDPLPEEPKINEDDLATIVYTSGTTGKPKGVMLSHANMCKNAYAGLQSVAVFPDDLFLSFLPLSHMFERTVGYYLTMMAGSTVAFNRSIAELLEDIAYHRPTAMITVPRIFERAHARISGRLEQGPAIKKWLFEQAVCIGWQRFEIKQGRAKWRLSQLFWPVLKVGVANKMAARFGGRLRFVVSGGAPLAPKIAQVFIGLGIDILQGYGLTESGPVLAVNTLENNVPSTVGLPLHGVSLRLGEDDELQVKAPYVMMGYWKNHKATNQTIAPDGWLLTGDMAGFSRTGHISITGRIKEIIVLANGEKVPPADMESAICEDRLFEQAMVMGEGRAYLTALIVLNPENWCRTAKKLQVDMNNPAVLNAEKVRTFVLKRVSERLSGFPGYAFVRDVHITDRLWTADDGALTPTLKVKRAVLRKRFKSEIENMYRQG